jgi:ubiquinone biosynthesis monooxygenase Coq7
MARGPQLDTLISAADRALRALLAPPAAGRPMPPSAAPARDTEKADAAMSPDDRRESAALMRVNHAGEVAAQALYHAQALFARNPDIREFMLHAAREETDHLAWCETRLQQLDSRPSLLNPLWYTGSLAFGFIAGQFGDRASLGFMAETERQVERHLASHMTSLPANDHASRAIVEQMRTDEAAHAAAAMNAGGVELPFPVRALMRATSKIMTRTAYYI